MSRVAVPRPVVALAAAALALAVGSPSAAAKPPAPAPPAGLRVTGTTASSVSLAWERPKHALLFGLYLDGRRVGHVLLARATFGDLRCGTTYELGVDSVSVTGARSAPAVVRAATAPCPDREPPTAPADLVATATESSVTVSWRASTDDVGVVGYGLTADGAEAGSTTATVHTFPGLGCGQQHTFGVRARDAAGNVSAETSVTARTRPCPADVFVAPNGSDFRWTHLAATFDGATLRLFVDGAEVASRPLAGAMPASGEPLRLGGNAVWDEWFAGRLDDVRIYDRALSGGEIAAAMSSATADPLGLVAAYAFDAGAGTTLADVSGRGNDGVVSGARWTADGRFGGALVFDGVDDLVTIPDSDTLDLGDAMTLAAWVRPDALGDLWRTVLVKEQPGALAYALYANTDSRQPSAHAFVGGADSWVRGTEPLRENACERADPCAGFARAYAVARDGQVVEAAAGEYALQKVGLDPAKGAGTVVFRPAEGATVVLDGIEVGARHVEVRDLTVGSATTFETAEDVVLRDLTVRGGLFVLSSQRVSVLGGSVGPGVDFHPMIAAADGSSTPPRDILVDGVTFHDWTRSGPGVHTECLQIGGGDGITVRNSRFRNCDVMDLHVTWFGSAPMTTDVTIENNFFSAAGDGGFFAVQANAYANLLIRNNSLGQGLVIFTGGGQQGPNTNVRVIGNVGPRDGSWACEPGVSFRHNVWDGATCDPTDLDAPSGFVDAAGGDFHLLPGSAAIDRGDPASYPETDIDGDRRPAQGGPDAGADEVVPSGPLSSGP